MARDRSREVSDSQGYVYAPAAGYVGYLVLRFLWRLLAGSGGESTPSPVASARPLAHRSGSPPNTSAPTAPQIATAPPRAPGPEPRIPVCRWTGDRELLAWRAWRLAILMDADEDEYGPRLLSLSAPWIWDGPAVRAELTPSAALQPPSGIYALKREVAERVGWQLSEDCWVTGWVALSGRVVEHAHGYRAERAVIRELRLAVGTHLAVRRLEMLRNLMDRLEERYQAPLDPGIAERRVADGMLANAFKPRCEQLPIMSLRPPWRLR